MLTDNIHEFTIHLPVRSTYASPKVHERSHLFRAAECITVQYWQKICTLFHLWTAWSLLLCCATVKGGGWNLKETHTSNRIHDRPGLEKFACWNWLWVWQDAQEKKGVGQSTWSCAAVIDSSLFFQPCLANKSMATRQIIKTRVLCVARLDLGDSEAVKVQSRRKGRLN